MGTLLWQLNDCWPVTSWSIIDHYKRPKAGWYAVKKAFGNNETQTDSIYSRKLNLIKPEFKLSKKKNLLVVECNTVAKYVFVSLKDDILDLSNNYFDISKNEKVVLNIKNKKESDWDVKKVKIISLYDILNK